MPTTTFTAYTRAIAGIGVAALTLVLTLAPGLSVGGVAQAASCPANGAHLLPVRGGRAFFSGVNVPWLNGGFGADFATIEEWNQSTYTSQAAEKMFSELAAKGVNSVRWWVFADGRGAPEFDSKSGGAVTGFDATTLPKMADAAKLAERYNIQIVFTLWSFDMLHADGTPSSNGEHAGGHRDLIVDAAKRKSFIDRALVPMLRFPVPGTNFTLGNHPAIYGWEVINEPEWAIREAGPSNAEIEQQVSLAEMQRFVAEVAGAIHRNSNQTVTVGAAAMKWNSTAAPGAQGNWWSDAALKQYDPQGYLDYYQIHFYDWMNGDANWSYSPLKVSWAAAGFDKPVVIGEFPANASGSGMSVSQMLNSMLNNCYAGVWGWSYAGVDGNGSWNDLSGPLGQFNSANAALVRLPGSNGTAPAPAAPAPTRTPAPTAPAAPAPAAPTAPAPTAAPAAGVQIYGDSLASGWANWSWGATVNLNVTNPARSGNRSIAVQYTSGWGGLYLHTDKPVATTGTSKLSFWLNGGSNGGQPLKLYIRDGSNRTSAEVLLPAPAAGRWTQVEVSLAQLGNPTAISEIFVQEAGGSPRPTYFLDDLRLVP